MGALRCIIRSGSISERNRAGTANSPPPAERPDLIRQATLGRTPSSLISPHAESQPALPHPYATMAM